MYEKIEREELKLPNSCSVCYRQTTGFDTGIQLMFEDANEVAFIEVKHSRDVQELIDFLAGLQKGMERAETCRISDLKPGERFYDRNGDVYTRLKSATATTYALDDKFELHHMDPTLTVRRAK